MLKLFLGWSGDVSHNVALTLRDWLPKVIQAVKPYVSSEDIAKGARWASEIAKELQTTSYGIICVTKENVHSPWINFEAGALSREIEKSYVTPFLFGLRSAEVAGPLSLFQHTTYARQDVLKLLSSINDRQEPEVRLHTGALGEAFDTYWPRLEAELDRIEKEQSATPLPEKRDPTAMLEELVDMTRALQRETWSRSNADAALQNNMLEQSSRMFREMVELIDARVGSIHQELRALFPPLPGQGEGLRNFAAFRDALLSPQDQGKEGSLKRAARAGSMSARIAGTSTVAATGSVTASGSEDGAEKGK